MAQRYVIGADVGSQGMKTILLDAQGSVALYREVYDVLQGPFRKEAQR